MAAHFLWAAPPKLSVARALEVALLLQMQALLKLRLTAPAQRPCCVSGTQCLVLNMQINLDSLANLNQSICC